jgi:hypothetical protein
VIVRRNDFTVENVTACRGLGLWLWSWFFCCRFLGDGLATVFLGDGLATVFLCVGDREWAQSKKERQYRNTDQTGTPKKRRRQFCIHNPTVHLAPDGVKGAR